MLQSLSKFNALNAYLQLKYTAILLFSTSHPSAGSQTSCLLSNIFVVTHTVYCQTYPLLSDIYKYHLQLQKSSISNIINPKLTILSLSIKCAPE